MSPHALRGLAAALTVTVCALGTAQAQEKLGVPACDNYFAKVEACVMTKAPEAIRTQYKAAMEQTRATWKTLAANPNTKATLEAACTQATQAVKEQLSAYGCQF
jgi:hypothetical protein